MFVLKNISAERIAMYCNLFVLKNFCVFAVLATCELFLAVNFCRFTVYICISFTYVIIILSTFQQCDIRNDVVVNVRVIYICLCTYLGMYVDRYLCRYLCRYIEL